MTTLNRERRRILLVEGQEDAWNIVAYKLEEHALFHARGFEEGPRLARRGYFDLYIIDNWLPDGSGSGLCRAIREFDPHTPILFHSAAAYEGDIQDALRAGAQDYLAKPIIPYELRQAVSRLISAANETVIEARRAARAAIREELAVRQTENAELRKKSEKLRLRSIRARARAAFLAAGGTRGDFAREWLSAPLEQARDACTPTAVNGGEHENG